MTNVNTPLIHQLRQRESFEGRREAIPPDWEGKEGGGGREEKGREEGKRRKGGEGGRRGRRRRTAITEDQLAQRT